LQKGNQIGERRGIRESKREENEKGTQKGEKERKGRYGVEKGGDLSKEGLRECEPQRRKKTKNHHFNEQRRTHCIRETMKPFAGGERGSGATERGPTVAGPKKKKKVSILDGPIWAKKTAISNSEATKKSI